MTPSLSISNVAVKSCASCLVALGLLLAGCTPETVGPSADDLAAQHESALKGVDQSSVSKTGKRSGPPIVPKSIKGRIKKDSQQ